MKTFWMLKIIHGCQTWVRVTTDYATWASLRHVAGPLVGCGVAIAVIPPAYERTPLAPFPERLREATPVPAPAFYYPPGSLDNGPEVVPRRPLVYVPPVPVPEPSALAVLAVGLGAVWWKRRKRKGRTRQEIGAQSSAAPLHNEQTL